MDVRQRQCSVCMQILEHTLEFFGPSKAQPYGLKTVCRHCITARQRTWSRRNHDKVAAAALRYRQGTLQPFCKDNPIFAKAYWMRKGVRRRATELRLPFDGSLLTIRFFFNWLQETGMCECCGRLFNFSPNSGLPMDDSPTIDRLIPHLGYVKGNIALLCWKCNRIKNNATLADFKAIVKWLEKYICP